VPKSRLLMRKRTRRLVIALVVVIIVAAISIIFYLRRRGASEAIRLLPETDAYVYINLKTIRRLTSFGEGAAPKPDPDYNEFVQATGFQFERDLDEAAFAVHTSSLPARGNAPATRYSEIFIGTFDSERANTFFRKKASAVENYRNIEVFNLPLEGRTVRVALLGLGTVAVSNTDGPQVIHGIIDRYKEGARPMSEPNLIRDFHKHVPFGSVVWAIARPGNKSGELQLPIPGGFEVNLPRGTVIVASARSLTGSIDARAEVFTSSEDSAQKITDQIGTFLTLFRAIESNANAGGGDPDARALFESLSVERNKDRAVMTAQVPIAFLEKLLRESPEEAVTTPEPEPAQPASEKPPSTRKPQK